MHFIVMHEILNCVEMEKVFFDSVNQFSAEDSAVTDLGYQIWRNELRSVSDRRFAFLHKMGFIEPAHSSCSDDQFERTEFESSLCSSVADCEEDSNVLFYGWEYDRNDNVVCFCKDDVELSSSSSSKSHKDACRMDKSVNKKIEHWWKEIMCKKWGMIGMCKSNKFDSNRTKVEVKRKRFKELSALFAMQEIRAHKGIIWAMKFSPDGQYLASGGEDGVVRVWIAKSMNSSYSDRFCDESCPGEKKVKVPIVLPDNMFQLEEQPVLELYGHVGEILDLAWSNSNSILSSSTDKTVRMWQIGYDECLHIYHHTDYVTCVQFNPVDNHFFISGSIDGKVRIWGVSKGRVLDWADAGDAVTALCYQPNGQGFVVGSIRGTCQLYETGPGDLVKLSANIPIHRGRKSSTRITGIQFSPGDSRTVMIMSGDSKLRIFDKMDFICKYQGLPKSRGQMSASFALNGSYIISIGEDSRVYIWNHENQCDSSSKHNKSIRSCEHFLTEGVSVAVPWSGTETGSNISNTWNTDHETDPIMQVPSSFSLGNLCSSQTWPEDMLRVSNLSRDQSLRVHQAVLPPTWGLVIVTADWDGMIRTFHNYGLPVSA